MKKEMLINVLQPEECRIAIVEDGVLEELYVERTSHESYVGNIYKGRIVNIEPSIQAAFVDFGVGRNGFLHVSDVEPAYYRHLEQGRHGGGGGRRGGGGGGRGRPDRPPGRSDDEPAPSYPRMDELDDLEDLPELVPDPLNPEPEAADETGPERRSAEGPEDRQEKRGRGERKGRRRGRGRARRRDDAPPRQDARPESGAPTENADPFPQGPSAGQSPEAPPDDRPRWMNSAERRTEEDEPGLGPIEPRPGLGDDELSFSRPEPVGAVRAAREHEAQMEHDEVFEDARAQETYAAPPAPLEDDEELTPADADDADDADDVEDDFMEDLEEEPQSRRRPMRDDRRGGRRPGGRRFPGRPGAGRPKPLIQDIFKRGQEVLVQVIKEGIGTKGPTLSTYISIAGRYLVLMPGLNRIGVSRKIVDDESRRRLREILHELKPPRGLGFIIRTAGQDRNKKELQGDLAYLSRLWQVVVRRIKKLKAPAEIYQESDMITRTIRDTFTSEIDTIWVDEKAAFDHAQEFSQIVMPRYANRIKLYEDSEPMFHKYGIEQEIARIQQRHVPLPNGGSIVIDQTEALVAIDVNSGNFRADNNAEETAYQMNLQAAKEIARQLRLRDLGGVIVNDFIDMREDRHRRGVEKAVRDAVKRDRARTKILKISQFGIIEMTRQRIRPSLKRSVYTECPHCLATGQVKTCESMSIDVMRLLQLAAHRDNIQRIQVKVHEDVAHYLLNRKRKEIARLEEAGEIQVYVTGVASASPELLEFGCFDVNNNEVKFLPFEDSRPRRR